MARFFSEQDIDQFRDCFYLNCKSGLIDDIEQLRFVMLSVGMSPTNEELNSYLAHKKRKIAFADFLDVAHMHLQVEKVPDEILRAFRASRWLRGPDKSRVHVSHLRHVLCKWAGPDYRLSSRELDALLRELNLDTSADIDYRQFVQALMEPPKLSND